MIACQTCDVCGAREGTPCSCLAHGCRDCGTGKGLCSKHGREPRNWRGDPAEIGATARDLAEDRCPKIIRGVLDDRPIRCDREVGHESPCWATITADEPTLDAYHLTTTKGERVVVVCPGGNTSPLSPDDAERWAREILRAVNRARDVQDGGA